MYPGSIFNLGADVDAPAIAIVDTNGNQLAGFDQSRPANATTVAVSQSATDAVILAANPARRAIILVNLAGQNLFVRLGSAATVTLYSFPVAGKSAPLFLPMDWYTGALHGIWSAAGSGSVLVTEVTT